MKGMDSAHTRQTRRIRTLIAMAVVTTLAFAFIGAKPALGYDDDPPVGSGCSSGEFCIWGSSFYGGDSYQPTSSDPSWPFLGGEGVANDDDALWNRESLKVYVYLENNYVEFNYCIEPDIADENINNSIDNASNSHQLISGTSCGQLQKP